MKKYLLALLLAGTVISVQAMEDYESSAAAAASSTAPKMRGTIEQTAISIDDQVTALKEQFKVYSSELARMMNSDKEAPVAQRAAAAAVVVEPNPVFDLAHRQRLRGELINLTRSVRMIDQLCVKRDSQAFRELLLEECRRKVEGNAQAELEFNIRAIEYHKRISALSLRPDKWCSPDNAAEMTRVLIEWGHLGANAADLAATEGLLNEMIGTKSTRCPHLLDYLENAHRVNANKDPQDSLTLVPGYKALLQEIQTVFEQDVAPAASRMEEIFFPQRVAERRTLEERVAAPARREPASTVDDSSRRSAVNQEDDTSGGNGLFD